MVGLLFRATVAKKSDREWGTLRGERNSLCGSVEPSCFYLSPTAPAAERSAAEIGEMASIDINLPEVGPRKLSTGNAV